MGYQISPAFSFWKVDSPASFARFTHNAHDPVDISKKLFTFFSPKPVGHTFITLKSQAHNFLLHSANGCTLPKYRLSDPGGRGREGVQTPLDPSSTFWLKVGLRPPCLNPSLFSAKYFLGCFFPTCGSWIPPSKSDDLLLGYNTQPPRVRPPFRNHGASLGDQLNFTSSLN